MSKRKSLKPKKKNPLEIKIRDSRGRLLTRKRGGITGVSAGIADYLGVEPTWIRLLLVVGTFLTSGFMILPYALAALALPKEGAENDGIETWQIESADDWPMYADDLPEASDVQRICWNCDTSVRPGAKYCHTCGEKLS